MDFIEKCVLNIKVVCFQFHMCDLFNKKINMQKEGLGKKSVISVFGIMQKSIHNLIKRKWAKMSST